MPGDRRCDGGTVARRAVVDEELGILLQLSVDILLYLLFDEEIRKYEP